MSARHLSCDGCRIRVRASAPEIGLLEGSCPICGAELKAVPFPSGVLGFRSFDLDALSEGKLVRLVWDPVSAGDLAGYALTPFIACPCPLG